MKNFLKISALRDLTTWDIAQMSEGECVDFIAVARWGSVDRPTCPICGTIDSHYRRPDGTRWHCKHCDADFSIFKNSVFQDTKLPYKKFLLAIKLFCEAAKGIAAHQLARNINCQVKSAHTLLGKLREALWRNRQTTKLQGLVHIDGGYFGGRPRKANKRFKPSPAAIAARVLAVYGGPAAARPKPHMSASNFRRRQNRRVVIVMREVSEELGVGGLRTITAIVPAETDEYVVPLINTFVAHGSCIMTDEAPAYGRLSAWYDHKTVNHQEMFSTPEGVQENQAEAFFSRLRRNVLGVTHRVTPTYLADLANEMAWRDDVRRCTEAEKIAKLLAAVFSNGLSRWFRGYWQKCRRGYELTSRHDINQAALKAA